MGFMGDAPSFERQCYDTSHNWFVVNGVDFTKSNNVSIGRVIQLQVFEKLFDGSQVNADHKGIKSKIKALNLEWTVRAIASIFDKYKDRNESDILFVYDVNNDPMIQALNIIGTSLQDSGNSISAVTVDSNIAKKCNLSRKVSWFKCFSIVDCLGAIKMFVSLRKARSKNFSRYFSFLVHSAGLQKAKKIDRYFKSQSFQALLEINSVLSLLQKKKPKVVVLASDAHRVSRVFVFLCKALNIKTVVYQHGATIWEYGYVPVYADRMLVWGKCARQWFEERGVHKDRLVEIGNVRSDEVGFKKLDESDFNHKRTVYFFPNPIDRNVTDMVITMLVRICEVYGLTGVLKLHPSEKNLVFFTDRVSQSSSNIKVSSDPIDKVGINPGDVAIVVNSTAGVDCCLEGAYVFNVEVDSMPNPIDYEGYGIGIKTSPEDYFDDFESLISISPSNYLSNREFFLRSYLGILDGKVKDRACNLIKGLLGNHGS